MKKLLVGLVLTLVACGDPQVDPIESPGLVSVDSVAPVDSGPVAPREVPVVVVPVSPDSPAFCTPGAACDAAGDPRLARLVDPSRSTFLMIPDNKLFSPGDSVGFVVCAKTELGDPVEGVPVVVTVKATRRTLAGNGLTKTGPSGCVDLKGVVTEADMKGDPRSPETDSGSYILNAYTGGRLVRQVRVLHDTF